MFVSCRTQFLLLGCALLVGCGGTPTPVEPAKPAEHWLTLDQTNIRVGWVATKRVAGKTGQIDGGWDDTGSISGAALLAADGAVRQLTATIEVASLWTANDTLTKVMLSPVTGFFELSEHPKATFISTAIKADVANTNATHVVEGLFQLNGIQSPITFPATIKVADGALKLDAVFSLDRQRYNCRLVRFPAVPNFTDVDISNDLAITLNVNTTKTPSAEVSTRSFDLGALPKTFTQTVEVFQVCFDMVLVPGDEGRGIRPLYVGKHEVTWDAFLPWVYCRDLVEYNEQARIRGRKLRPTLPYGDITRGYGTEGFPAISMTKLAAVRYCQWLSEQTGLKYRLPTEKEWERIYQLGRGGKSAALTDDEAAKVAVYEANSFVAENGNYQTRAVGSKAADLLGLHDMAGNVAEWVDDTGEDQKVCGGHYKCGFAQLGGHDIVWGDQGWPGVPQEPRSDWWFIMYPEVGFRVVCEP